MIKRLIFDIDNTLIVGTNFAPYICMSLSEYGIYDYNKTLEFIECIKKYGEQYDNYDYDNYLKFFSEQLGVKLDRKFLKIFFNNLRNCVPDKEYNKLVKKTLKELLKEYELVLLSNYFEKSQRGRLEVMGINQLFSDYYGEKISKPNPKAYIDSAGPHKTTECLIIGDDKKLDIDIPEQFGFNTLYVNKYNLGDITTVTEITPSLIKKLEIK